MEDFEARTGLAAKALTKAQLLDALEGLPGAAPGRAMPEARAGRGDSAAPSTRRYNEDPAPRQAALGGFERKGPWRAPRRMESPASSGAGSWT